MKLVKVTLNLWEHNVAFIDKYVDGFYLPRSDVARRMFDHMEAQRGDMHLFSPTGSSVQQFGPSISAVRRR
jgi:hypothetical protein